jgi:hypothetical protein
MEVILYSLFLLDFLGLVYILFIAQKSVIPSADGEKNLVYFSLHALKYQKTRRKKLARSVDSLIHRMSFMCIGEALSSHGNHSASERQLNQAWEGKETRLITS